MPAKVKGRATLYPATGKGEHWDARVGVSERLQLAEICSTQGLALCDEHDWDKSYGRVTRGFVDEKTGDVKADFEITLDSKENCDIAESIAARVKTKVSLGQLPPLKYKNELFEVTAALYPFEMSFCEKGEMDGAKVDYIQLVDENDRVLMDRVIQSGGAVSTLYSGARDLRHQISLEGVKMASSAPPASASASASAPAPPATATETPPAASAPAALAAAPPTTTTETSAATSGGAAGGTAAQTQTEFTLDPSLMKMVPAGVNPTAWFVQRMAVADEAEERRRAEVDAANLQRQEDHKAVMERFRANYTHMLNSAMKTSEAKAIQRNIGKLDAITEKLRNHEGLTPDESMELVRLSAAVASASASAGSGEKMGSFTQYNDAQKEKNKANAFTWFHELAPEIRKKYAPVFFPDGVIPEAAQTKEGGGGEAQAQAQAAQGQKRPLTEPFHIGTGPAPAATQTATPPIGASASLTAKTQGEAAEAPSTFIRVPADAPKFHTTRIVGEPMVPIGASQRLRGAYDERMDGPYARQGIRGFYAQKTGLMEGDKYAKPHISEAVRRFCETEPIVTDTKNFSPLDHPAMALIEPMARQDAQFANTLRLMAYDGNDIEMPDSLRQKWRSAQRGRPVQAPRMERKAFGYRAPCFTDKEPGDFPCSFTDPNMLPPNSGHGSTLSW